MTHTLTGPQAASDHRSALAPRNVWLFSRTADLLAFGGSAAVSLLLLWVGWHLGLLHGETPEWAWVPAILLIDIAHVWSTGFRVYFDRQELARRPLLYFGVPLAAYVLCAALYAEGELLFWRVLAYLAVFHFVRQQYGWVRLYQARCGETARLGRWIDTAVIYLATVYPLVFWHAHLPRRFWWFLPGDFLAVPALLADVLQPLYWLALAAWLGSSLRAVSRGQWNPGKDLVILTTAVCWYLGIVVFNSDYAFTVTNVVIHGVPYLVLVFWSTWPAGAVEADTAARPASPAVLRPSSWPSRLLLFIGTIWLLATVEAMLWDRAVFQERSWLFGSPVEIGAWKLALVPLLAVPQVTHYVLDGFIWKRRGNPRYLNLPQADRAEN